MKVVKNDKNLFLLTSGTYGVAVYDINNKKDKGTLVKECPQGSKPFKSVNFIKGVFTNSIVAATDEGIIKFISKGLPKDLKCIVPSSIKQLDNKDLTTGFRTDGFISVIEVSNQDIVRNSSF